jgi:predicted Zn-dependent protease
METGLGGTIDDPGLHFQFGCELAWEVKRGRRTRLLKNPFYTGITSRFWAGCDAIGRPSEARLFGLFLCGKRIAKNEKGAGNTPGDKAASVEVVPEGERTSGRVPRRWR